MSQQIFYANFQPILLNVDTKQKTMTATDNKFPLLQTINSPDDVRALPESKLSTLADELRQFVICSVAQTGGHLSAGLGTVELTLALHYVYNTPNSKDRKSVV